MRFSEIRKHIDDVKEPFVFEYDNGQIPLITKGDRRSLKIKSVLCGIVTGLFFMLFHQINLEDPILWTITSAIPVLFLLSMIPNKQFLGFLIYGKTGFLRKKEGGEKITPEERIHITTQRLQEYWS